jgi:outer membrane protein TolC
MILEAFEAGDIELLALNIYESSVADARLQLLEAHFKYFTSLAQYKTLVRPTAFSTADQF